MTSWRAAAWSIVLLALMAAAFVLFGPSGCSARAKPFDAFLTAGLLVAYAGRDAETAYIRGRLSTALFRAAWGGGIAIAAAVIVLANRNSGPLSEQALFPLLFIVSLAAYNFGHSVWRATFLRLRITDPTGPNSKSAWRILLRRGFDDLVLPVIGLVVLIAAHWAIGRPAFTLVPGLYLLALSLEWIRVGMADTKGLMHVYPSRLEALALSGGLRLGGPMVVVSITACVGAFGTLLEPDCIGPSMLAS